MELNAKVKAFSSREKKLVGRVLILEDDPLAGEWLCQGLSRRGVECLWAQDLESALSQLGNNDSVLIHGIISDVYMKDQVPDGMQLIQKAKQFDIPIGVISSRPDLPLVMEAINTGASFFLKKPFEVDELLTKLSEIWAEPKHMNALLERFLELHRLTEKEREVARLLFKGLSNKEIASVLNVTEKTIKFHVTGIFEKCNVKSRSELTSTVFPV